MTLTTIIAILSEIISVPEDDLRGKTRLTGNGGLAPIDVAKLVIEVEKRFGLTIHDEDVHTLATLSDMAAYVDAIQNA